MHFVLHTENKWLSFSTRCERNSFLTQCLLSYHLVLSHHPQNNPDVSESCRLIQIWYDWVIQIQIYLAFSHFMKRHDCLWAVCLYPRDASCRLSLMQSNMSIYTQLWGNRSWSVRLFFCSQGLLIWHIFYSSVLKWKIPAFRLTTKFRFYESQILFRRYQLMSHGWLVPTFIAPCSMLILLSTWPFYTPRGE